MKIIHFLLTKLFAIAKTQEPSVGLHFALFWLLYLFEMFHLLMIGLLLKIFGYSIRELSLLHQLGIFGVLGMINYFALIKNQRIETIYNRYQDKYSGAKYNLIFLLYFILIFFILFIEGRIYKTMHN